MQELQTAEEALERARTGLQERDFLIIAHERAEDALASHALDLSTRLEAACADVKTLSHRCVGLV